MKAAHKRRIEIVTDIQEDRASHVLLYGARIGLNESPLSFDRARIAMLPERYPLSAKAFISEALAFEEKYDLLVSNFLELEKTLNDLAADHTVRADYSLRHRLAAAERNPDGTWRNHSALFMGMIERRRHFLRRNRNLNKLKQWARLKRAEIAVSTPAGNFAGN